MVIFRHVYHIFVNRKNVIDLVKLTVLILNVHANDLVKYLALIKWWQAGNQHRGTGNAPVLGATFEGWLWLEKVMVTTSKRKHANK